MLFCFTIKLNLATALSDMEPENTRSNIIRWLYTKKESPTAFWCDFNQARLLLKPADVLLIDGNTLADRKIKAITGSRWSQVCLYLGRLHDIRNASLRAFINDHLDCQSDTQLIFKADLVKGMHITTLSELRQQTFRICRPHELTEDDTQNIVNYTINRASTTAKHAWWPAVRLLLVPWTLLPMHWRQRLFRALSGRRLRRAMGGTVGDAFSFIQFPILPLVRGEDDKPNKLYRQYPSVFYPADFDLSPYFDVIKYPFIGNANQKVRLHAWDGHIGSLIEDEPSILDLPNNLAKFKQN